MGFFSDPYAEGHAHDIAALGPWNQRILAEAAQRGYSGDLVLPGVTYKMDHGDVVAQNKQGGGWTKFAITAAALVGGGIAAGGGLPAGASSSGAPMTATATDVSTTVGGGAGATLPAYQTVSTAGALAPSLQSGLTHGLTNAARTNGLDLVKLLIGLGGTGILAAQNHGSNTPAIDPQQQQLMNDALRMGNQRMQSTQPVHEAAMRLAMGMAPSGGSERIQQAAYSAQQPRPQVPQNPAILDAVRRLTGAQ